MRGSAELYGYGDGADGDTGAGIRWAGGDLPQWAMVGLDRGAGAFTVCGQRVCD